MKILSIETSCDDTAISIFEAKGGTTNASFRVLANNSNSQINIHIPYGGVYPVLAKREHAKNLPILLEDALRKAKIRVRQDLTQENLTLSPSPVRRGLGRGGIDLIAVTYGPGLEMCLWEGISFAKSLAKKWSAGRRSAIPVIPVNHMEGHVLSVFGKHKGKFSIPKLKAPILSLLVSGGHTQLVLIPKKMSAQGGSALGGHYEIIGETLDDAVGEAFDKVARMLDLPYPGGPQISKLAEEARKRVPFPLNKGENERGFLIQEPHPTLSLLRRGEIPFALPRPMLHSKNFDFSFSGLKTAVLYLIRDLIKKDPNILQDNRIKQAIALEFENAAIECLVYKTKKAIEKYGVKTLIVAGGVAANKHLRKEIQKIIKPRRLKGSGSRPKSVGIKLLLPTKELAGDNSLMIGIAGYLNYIKLARRGGNKNLPAQAGKVPKLDSIKATGNLRL